MTRYQLNRATFLRSTAGAIALLGLGAGTAGAARAPMHGGVAYDTGVLHFPGTPLSREVWSRALMEREIRVIRDELRCDSITAFGSDIGRLTETTAAALRRGLEVFVQPRLYDHPQPQILEHLAEAARQAERVRGQHGGRVTLAVGCEHVLFTPGIVPGETFLERIENLQELPPEEFPALARRLNTFVHQAAEVARANFRGPLTYGAASFEPIDWSPFDIIGLDYYEHFQTPAEYTSDLARFRRWRKPIMIMEFGSSTYVGAPERGGMGWDIVDHEADPPRIVGDHVRSERVQAEHLTRMLRIFAAENLMGAHIYTFIAPDAPHSPCRELDLDLASFSLVKVIRHDFANPASRYRWEPKQSFHALARHNRR